MYKHINVTEWGVNKGDIPPDFTPDSYGLQRTETTDERPLNDLLIR
jgi:hypothetical protein